MILIIRRQWTNRVRTPFLAWFANLDAIMPVPVALMVAAAEAFPARTFWLMNRAVVACPLDMLPDALVIMTSLPSPHAIHELPAVCMPPDIIVTVKLADLQGQTSAINSMLMAA